MREDHLGMVLTTTPTFSGANWISIQHQQHSKRHDQFGSIAQGSTLDNNQEQLTLQPDKMIRYFNKTTSCMLISMLIPCFTHPGGQPIAWKFPCCRHTAPMLLMAFPALKTPNKIAETEDVHISNAWVGSSLAPFLLEGIFLNILKMLQLSLLLPSVLTRNVPGSSKCNIPCLGFWGEIR